MRGVEFGYFFFLTVDSITARDNVQPRRWGMQVEVTDDPTSENNTTWILKKGLANTDINDNDNWQKLVNIAGTNSLVIERLLAPHSGVISAQSLAVASDEIADGECLTMEVLWTAKDDNTNTGAGGKFFSSWTKAGGVLNKVFDNNTINGADTGDTFTLATSDVAGAIAVDISTLGIASNYSVSWYAIILIRQV